MLEVEASLDLIQDAAKSVLGRELVESEIAQVRDEFAKNFEWNMMMKEVIRQADLEGFRKVE